MENYIKVVASGGSTRSTAMLMKTGQTVSFVTGDDGDIELGRGVSLLTLLENNPFGNTNRFTALDGSQTYTNNIVLDWSTFDGSKVLGYYRVPLTSASRDSGVSTALSFSTGGYTSGWKMLNLREYINLFSYDTSLSTRLNYAPFNLTGSYWTSTSYSSTVGYYVITSGTYHYYGAAISTSFQYLVGREFTVTGTTIT